MSRGPLIAGIDVSSTQLNVALLPLDPNVHALVELRSRPLMSARRDDNAPRRLRYVRNALHDLLADPSPDEEITAVFVERPMPPAEGQRRQGHDLLVETFAAVCSNIPKRIEVCGALYPQTWRSHVKLDRLPEDRIEPVPPRRQPTWKRDAWKRSAIARVRQMEIVEFDWRLTDHEADSILVAVAGRGLHWQNEKSLREERVA